MADPKNLSAFVGLSALGGAVGVVAPPVVATFDAVGVGVATAVEITMPGLIQHMADGIETMSPGYTPGMSSGNLLGNLHNALSESPWWFIGWPGR